MEYELREGVPTAEEYRHLREATGLSPRSREAAERGLPNTIHGAVVVHDGETVGMGRIVGDDGSFYQIVDIAVLPEHQGQGLGTRIVEALMAYLEEHAPPTSYVSLMADVDGFYERFGFERTAPESKGMAQWME